ncbi:hypothetical protein HKCCE3408_09525 [Rhodobacterales bacterium HKCCE3408]|nr:hypothetical protein [Rhodobacterales bacterium HKCCE3408]
MRPVQDPTLHKSPKFTPEQHLAFAVVMQAIEELNSSDERVKFEAHEFFLQPSGPWADMRRFYFDALDLNDDYVHASLTARLDPPERPHKKWT